MNIKELKKILETLIELGPTIAEIKETLDEIAKDIKLEKKVLKEDTSCSKCKFNVKDTMRYPCGCPSTFCDFPGQPKLDYYGHCKDFSAK